MSDENRIEANLIELLLFNILSFTKALFLLTFEAVYDHFLADAKIVLKRLADRKFVKIT